MEVQIDTSGTKSQSTRIEVAVHGPLDFHNVRIRPEPLVRLGGEIKVGHPTFDNTFFIEGPVKLVFALLDAPTRALLLRISSESRLEIFDGALRADVPHEKVSKFLPLLLDIGQRFAQTQDVPQRLAANAGRDPEAGVRLQNLLILIRELPGEPGTLEALRKACSDASPEIRLRAAKELGSERRDVLLELAEHKWDDTLSAEAVSILGRELLFERARAILDHALSRHYIQTACACLEVLSHSKAAAAVDVLAEVMVRQEGRLAAVAAQALGATRSPAAEPPLILALQSEYIDLRMAAANALGRIGTVEAVLPLKAAAERSWLDRELPRTARQAIAEIQSRLRSVSPGQLSLAGTEAGQLSLAEAEAGQLSLATDAGGQLSFPSVEPEQPSLGGEID